MSTKTPTNRQLEAAAEFEAARIRIKLIREGILEDISRESGISLRPARRGFPLLDGEGPKREMPRFDIPATRSYRFATATGVTSLHFAHRGIAKVTYEVRIEGLKVKPGAARAHANYVERESGVAKFDGEKSRDEARQPSSDVDTEKNGAPKIGKASEQDEYVRRTTALAMQPDGKRALVTNIDEDDAERSEFWSEVEKNERTASPDKMSFKVMDNPEFWLRVADAPGCPAKLKQKILGPSADHDTKFVIENGKKTRAFLRGQEGWRGPGDGVTPANDESAMAGFHDGRGGRIQYRSEFSLPVELTQEQNFELLKEFAHEFEKRRIRFVGVMHRPDEHNDNRNWHAHFVYYDRPCRRITQDDIDFLKKQGFDVSGITPGAWDFTVSVPTPGRPDRVSYPLRQNKVAEVSRTKKWPKTLRVRLAAITNRHLQLAGIDRRVSAENYENMGIVVDPQQHLGTSQNAAETKGHVTSLGCENEAKQWEGILNEIETRFNFELTNNRERVAAAPLNVREALGTTLNDAAQYRKNADLLEQEMQRAKSRAEMVVERNSKLLTADRDSDDDNADLVANERARLVQQGRRYLDELHNRTRAEQELLQSWRNEVDKCETIAANMESGKWRSDVGRFQNHHIASDSGSSSPPSMVPVVKPPRQTTPSSQSPSLTSHPPIGVSVEDKARMATKPFYLSKRSDGALEVLAVDAPQGFRSAAANPLYADEFARWYEKQEVEQAELTKLIAQSNCANRAEIEATVKAERADARVKQLWERWERTPLITHVVEVALAMRRNRERALADKKERAQNQHLAAQMDVSRGK